MIGYIFYYSLLFLFWAIKFKLIAHEYYAVWGQILVGQYLSKEAIVRGSVFQTALPQSIATLQEIASL